MEVEGAKDRKILYGQDKETKVEKNYMVHGMQRLKEMSTMKETDTRKDNVAQDQYLYPQLSSQPRNTLISPLKASHHPQQMHPTLQKPRLPAHHPSFQSVEPAPPQLYYSHYSPPTPP